MTHIFGARVSPILQYGWGTWGIKQPQPSQTIQNRAMRYFLGVNTFACNIILQGHMAWPPIAVL